ncbi:phosphatidate cytidylyltransferase [Hyunsoonleella jejuensis]|uniref:Phosphatidate cytidylyltransferase n=2 Tax=Hyunsoonleella jejuensis TaxID=419940 RepID=A0A1H9J3M8_9FLAO|nr:phosphatidate cytidylyltransferase [Hyunsoonleella jejuensis]
MLLRSLSGLLYVVLLIVALSLNTPHLFTILFFILGILSLFEFNKLIQLKSVIPYVIFTILYAFFGYWQMAIKSDTGVDEATQILVVITIFVDLFLIKDLFSRKTIPLFITKRFIITTFYLSSGFVFLVLIARVFSAKILLGAFILVWVNDSFAYLIGKNFGKQKLFEKISPKKTVEGFLGGLFFSCIASYFIASLTNTLSFTNWLMLAIIVTVFGTLGDLIESKFKRQAEVKDSGTIMPGHGGLLDRLDSIIFASPFIYVFLRILHYVS